MKFIAVVMWIVAALNLANWGLSFGQAGSAIHQIYFANQLHAGFYLLGIGAMCWGIGILIELATPEKQGETP